MKYIGSYERDEDILRKLEELFKQGITKDQLQVVSNRRLLYENDPNLFRIDEYDNSFYDVPSKAIVADYKDDIEAGKTLIFQLDSDKVKKEDATGKIACTIVSLENSPTDSCYFRDNVLPGDECINTSGEKDS